MQLNLLDILQYQRGHGSVSEASFINHYLLPMINELGYHGVMDGQGNIWVEVASKEKAPFLFCAHIDTCHKGDVNIHPVTTPDGVIHLSRAEKAAGCLGADDGVGIYTNLRLIEAGIKGTYLFTRGEECGGIGAEYIAKQTPDKLEGFLMCIEVDRAGTDEVIVSQAYGDCASVEFGEQLSEMLGMGHSPSTAGVYTDNAEFGDIIPESVNIAAGYENQHTAKETVNTIYVEALIKKLIAIDWNTLRVVRERGDYGEWMDYYGGNTMYDYPAGDYEKLLEYVEMHPSRVANYLDAIGVDMYEIEKEWMSGDLEVGRR